MPCSPATQDDASGRLVLGQLKARAQHAICNADAPLPCSQECVDNVARLLSAGAPVDNVVQEGRQDHRFVGHQEHLLTFAGELPRKERAEYKAKVRAIDCTSIREALTVGVGAIENPLDRTHLVPPNEIIWSVTRPKALARGAHIIRMSGMPDYRRRALQAHGFEMICRSSVAVVLLAGAMDRRLGQGKPPGTANVGLLSGKSLFQVYAERVLRLRHLVQRYLDERVFRIEERRMGEEEFPIPQGRRRARRSSAREEMAMLQDGGIDALDTLTPSTSFDFLSTSGSESASSASSTSGSESMRDEDMPIGLGNLGNLRKRMSGKLRSVYHILQQLGIHIPIAIMCNEHNRLEIEDFWRQNDFFGLPAADVHFFNQSTMPAMEQLSGRIFLQSKHQMAIHPNGGGGVFQALRDEGLLAQLKASGVEHVFIASQDNLLLRVADPLFLGLCATMKVKAGVKCVAKGDVTENLGIFCNRRPPNYDLAPSSVNKPHLTPVVLEPPEMAADAKACLDGHGNVCFDAASICQFYFTMNAVCNVAEKMPVTWHALRRRQPHINLKTGAVVSPPPGALNSFRLEMFVQDGLEVVHTALGLVVSPSEEWAYVKHPQGASSPATALLQMGKLHFNWVCSAGAVFSDGLSVDVGRNRCEVSPLVSYEGEDLSESFGGSAEMSLPMYIQSQLERDKATPLGEGSVVVAQAADWIPGKPMRRVSSMWALPPSSFVEHIESSRMQQDLYSRPAHGALGANFKLSAEFMEAASDSELPSTPEEMRIARSTLDERVRLAEQEALRKMADRDGNFFSESDFDAFDAFADDSPSERTDSPRSAVSSLPMHKLPRIPQRSNVTSRIPNGQRKMAFSLRRQRPNLTGLESGYKPPPEDADVALLNLNLQVRARCNRQSRTTKASLRPRVIRKFVTHTTEGAMLEVSPPEGQMRYQWTLGRVPFAVSAASAAVTARASEVLDAQRVSTSG